MHKRFGACKWSCHCTWMNQNLLCIMMTMKAHLISSFANQLWYYLYSNMNESTGVCFQSSGREFYTLNIIKYWIDVHPSVCTISYRVDIGNSCKQIKFALHVWPLSEITHSLCSRDYVGCFSLLAQYRDFILNIFNRVWNIHFMQWTLVMLHPVPNVCLDIIQVVRGCE